MATDSDCKVFIERSVAEKGFKNQTYFFAFKSQLEFSGLVFGIAKLDLFPNKT
jgi:hypothetical protein